MSKPKPSASQPTSPATPAVSTTGHQAQGGPAPPVAGAASNKATAATAKASADALAAERPRPVEEPLPKDLPPYGKERMPPAVRIEQRKLANGLTIWILPREDGPPKVHFVLTVRGGLADDPALQVGLSTLLAEMLKEGTEARDAFTVAQDLQSYGGDMQTEAGVDGLTISMSGLASNAAKVVTLLSEVALQPSFPPQEIEQAKLRTLQALAAQEVDPDYQARRAMNGLVYPGHPYGNIYMDQRSLLSITPEMLESEHARRFRPDQTLLVVTGRITPDAAYQMADNVFGDWQAEGRPSVGVGTASTNVVPRRLFIARGDSVQSAIRIGRPAVAANSPDYYPLQLTNAVLGGGFRSRLNQNLREDKGFTYGAGSSYSAERSGGALIAAANVRNEVTGAAIAQFLREFRELGETPVPEDELAQTKHYLAGGYLLLNQQQEQVAFALSDYWLIGLPPETLSDYVPKIAAVSAAQVQTMARKYFSPKDQSIVVVGDEEVKSQLKPYGEFEQASQ